MNILYYSVKIHIAYNNQNINNCSNCTQIPEENKLFIVHFFIDFVREVLGSQPN